MSRLVTVRSLYLLLTIGGVSAAQEPPTLEPPSLEPPRTNPPQASAGATPGSANPRPAATARPIPPRADVRPMLAIPGVTAPAVRPPAAHRPRLGGPDRARNAASPPPLDALPRPAARAPLGAVGIPLTEDPAPSLELLPPRTDRYTTRRPLDAPAAARPGTAIATPAAETIPLTIEPLDDKPVRRPDATPRGAATRPPTDRTTGGTGTTRPARDDEPIDRRLAPRRGGVLSRLFGMQPAPPRDEPRAVDAKPRRGSSPDADLDPDLAARRRIERQIRATLGDKIRSFDVQVTGRNAVVNVQPSRFWLRRSVRRSLETLPALQGYRTRIDVRD